MLAGAAGGAIAIASMEAFSATTAFPLVAIPFATSIVTVLGSPKADPSQPRASIGGQLQPCSEHACGYKLANDGQDTRALQYYLGHKNIQHTVRYTELSPDRFRDFWRD